MIIEELFQEHPLPKPTTRKRNKRNRVKAKIKSNKEKIEELKKQRSLMTKKKQPFLYTSDLSDGIVTNEKIANQAVDETKIKKGSVKRNIYKMNP